MAADDRTLVQPTATAAQSGSGDEALNFASTPGDDATHVTTTSHATFAGTFSSPTSPNPTTSGTLTGSLSTNLSAGSPVELAVGSILKQRFQLLEVLGEGGMGVVFKAADVRKLEAHSRNPYVAIKVLNASLSSNHTLIAGLQRECEKAQELAHPNIITVYDFDRDGHHVFMSMEYLVGRTLAQLIRETRGSGGMSLSQCWPIIKAMGEALAYAHKKHIVHSDFKPANVFITEQGDVKVLDFGIAARLGQSESDETIFNARAEGGLTPPYASFEMLNGSRADPRDDVYAFGLVVYEMLTGQHPYQRKPASNVFLEQRKGPTTILSPIGKLNRKQWQLLKASIEILQENRPANLEDWLAQFSASQRPRWLYPALIGTGVVALSGVALIVSQRHGIESETKVAAPIAEYSNQADAEPSAPEPPAAPPLAQAGNDQQALIGETVTLNGNQSRSNDGSPLNHAWRLTSRPSGSESSLQNPNNAEPHFVPDRPGRYVAELTVTDAQQHISQPATVNIDVSQPPITIPPSHQATSQDGVLSLSTGKPQYRIGEALELTLSVNRDGYLRVAYVTSTGDVAELLPNKYQPAKVKAGITYRIPPKPDSFKLQITGPSGFDQIIAVFSDKPITGIKNIARSDAALVSELAGLSASAVTVRYEVIAN